MFDDYEPVPTIACPLCASPIRTWQGRDGPCARFLWRQGEAHPIDQPIDGDARIERDRYREFVLPAAFTIVGDCANGHRWTSDCRCRDGVWKITGSAQPLSDGPTDVR